MQILFLVCALIESSSFDSYFFKELTCNDLSLKN